MSSPSLLTTATPTRAPLPLLILPLLEEEEPTSAPFVLCEVGAMEPSIVVQVPEPGEQRNTLQKFFLLLRRENAVKVHEP